MMDAARRYNQNQGQIETIDLGFCFFIWLRAKNQFDTALGVITDLSPLDRGIVGNGAHYLSREDWHYYLAYLDLYT